METHQALENTSAYLYDVSNPQAGGEIAARISSEHGRLDTLVNNAGLRILAQSKRMINPNGAV